MGRMKELSEYLVKTCPLFEGLPKAELDVFEEAMQLDGDTIYNTLLCAEIRDDGVYWRHNCTACGEIHETLMHDDFEYIGQTPAEEEDCCGKYTSYQTCMALRLQLRNTFGKEPEGARLALRTEMGGGGYYEVVCHWSAKFPMSYAYAMFLEGNLPAKWSPAAKAYLKTITA